MIWVELAGAVLLILESMFLMNRVSVKTGEFFEERLREQDATEEGRRVALYKQQKATERTVMQSDRAVRKMVDQTRQLHKDTQLMQQRTEAHFAHPEIKRITGRGGEERG